MLTDKRVQTSHPAISYQIPAGGKQSSRGFVLATTIVFLFILSFVGISAMRSTTIDERMSGNAQEFQHAFELAESGIARSFRDVSILNTGSNQDNPTERDYETIFSQSDSMKTHSYYRGESLTTGQTLEEVNSLDEIVAHLFHIQSEAKYKKASAEHAQGLAILGPKTK